MPTATPSCRLTLLALATACASLGLTTFASASLADGQPYSVAVNQQGFLINGEYKILRGGSLQWFKLPPEAWEDRLRRFKAAGFNTVDMYVAWNQVEKQEGVFDFENPNIRSFLDLCQELGIYVYFRPGPYITNEIDGGGVPGWLMDKTTKRNTKADGLVNLRTDDPDFLGYVERYFKRLNEVVRPYLASNGGPIILYSLENEYNWFEIFHEVDKFAIHNGRFERSWLSMLPTRNYFTALRDIVWAQGIDVPLTSCPGNGKTTGMASVPGIIPMPNIYNGLGGELPEKVVYDLLQNMHDPNNHAGAYVNFPSGTTETDRDPVRIKRMIMAGFDAVFPFNIVGSHQEGYMNSMVLNANGGNILGNLFEFSLDRLVTGFLAPTVGYFHNVVDYDGAVSPSGLHRATFYDFRRDNLMIDTIEPYLAPSTHALRSGDLPGADPRVCVANAQLGAIEGENRIHYWKQGADGTRFLSLVNQSDDTAWLAPGSIIVEEVQFPRFSDMAVTLNPRVAAGQFGDIDASNAVTLTLNLPVPGIGRLAYSTSELVTLRDYNGDQLLVVHGAEGTPGELSLSRLQGVASIDLADSSFDIQESNAQQLTVTYNHQAHQMAVVTFANGQRLRLIVTTPEEAGRFWFETVRGQDVMIAGPDMVTQNQNGSLAVEFDRQRSEWLVMAPPALRTIPGLDQVSTGESITQVAYYHTPELTIPTLDATLLHQGKANNDVAEAQPDYSLDASWQQWQGQPDSLESKDIIKGHAWYRTEITLDSPQDISDALYIEHASDIVGLYVNGQYLTTLAPIGTEIDSKSKNVRYRFNNLSEHLTTGRNVLAFRTEIWGHGSFMFPRGKLLGTPGQLPAVGFDSEKGLFGKAQLGNKPLGQWAVRADLGGERANFASPQFNDSTWSVRQMPGTLSKGDVLWYRTQFDAAALPNPADIHAPLVLTLEGRRSKATIFINGRLVGRWLSDSDWLNRGTWARGQRDMWMNTSPDDFPVNAGLLNPPGTPNTLAIVFEDASGHNEAAGEITTLRFNYAKENRGNSAFKGKTTLNW